MKTILLALMFTFLLSEFLAAQIPQTLSFQGILTDTAGTPKSDGIYLLTFRFYTNPTGGAPVWSEQNSVEVKRGLFHTRLGSQVSFTPAVKFEIPYFLAIEISGESELSPRIPLTASAYSFTSAQSISSSYADTALVSLVTVSDTIWKFSGSHLYRLTGNIGIGTSSPGAKLDVAGSIKSNGLNVDGLTSTNNLEINSNAQSGSFLFSFDNNGSASWSTKLRQFNGLIGIGTADPETELDVNGRIKASTLQLTNNAANGRLLLSGSTGIANWTDNLFFLGGNLGIGSESPAARLHVVQSSSGFNPTATRTAIFENGGNVTMALRTLNAGSLSINFERSVSNAGAVINSRADGDLRFGRFIFNDINSTSAAYQLHLDVATGNFGIGREPITNDLEVAGNASKSIAGDWLANSDRRIKKDITEINNAQELLLKLHPVKFKYTNEWRERNISIKDQYYYNFIAQEFRDVFPEAVVGSGEYLKDDPEEILQIDSYNAQIITIKAAQEIILENKKLRSEVSQLRDEINNLYEYLERNKIVNIKGVKQ